MPPQESEKRTDANPAMMPPPLPEYSSTSAGNSPTSEMK
jgi:hypothetical protein